MLFINGSQHVFFLCINILFNFQSLVLYCTDLGFAYLLCNMYMHGNTYLCFWFFFLTVLFNVRVSPNYLRCLVSVKILTPSLVASLLCYFTANIYKHINWLSFKTFTAIQSEAVFKAYPVHFSFEPHCLKSQRLIRRAITWPPFYTTAHASKCTYFSLAFFLSLLNLGQSLGGSDLWGKGMLCCSLSLRWD